ncbi:MAG: FliH/SctL family protein [Velocimicrobium sp.]
MTKLLSNIIKWNYINFDGTDKHVIDSDNSKKGKKSIFDNTQQRLIEGIHITSPQEIADNVLKGEIEGLQEPGFIEGMNATDYDKMMDEEKKRIATRADSLISDAKEKASKLIEEANVQVEQIKGNAFEEGKLEGFENGLLEGQKEISKKELEMEEAEKAIIQRRNELEEEYQGKKKELEPYFAQLLISLIEKVTGVLLENKDDIILHLIKKGLEDVGRNKHFLVHVSSVDLPIVKEAKDRIVKTLPEECSIEIVEDDSFVKNQCVIETETKMIDSSLDIQLRNLMEDLKLLSMTK